MNQATSVTVSEVSGPAGLNRLVKFKLANCTPRAERLIRSICELFCSVREDEWEHLLAGRAALVVTQSERVELTYEVCGSHASN